MEKERQQRKKHFVSIDSGKYGTKSASYTEGGKEIKKTYFRTKISPGDFREDMLEKGTYIVQVDGGDVYKIGLTAKEEPNSETNKKTEIHRVSSLFMIGLSMLQNKITEADVYAAVHAPISVMKNLDERLDYKEFIFGKEGAVHTVKIKASSEGPVNTVVFTIRKRYVYPEGFGSVFKYADKVTSPVGIIDIGNININLLMLEDFIISDEDSMSAELGGKIMISQITEDLESAFSARFRENTVAKKLIGPASERYFKLNNSKGGTEYAEHVKQKSREIMERGIAAHVAQIKAKCDAKGWPIEVMDFLFVGGTTKLLKDELGKVFGDNIIIPENPEFVTVEGTLLRICAANNVNLDGLAG